MRFDVDLHRHTIRLDKRVGGTKALEMSVIDVGPDEGDRYQAPTMVLIHGFGGRAAYWEYQLEQFQHDYRVIALDLRGHGLTDAPTETDGAHYDVAELVGDIEAALDVLRVPEKYMLVCHSFGGALCSQLVQQHAHRVSALVIIASAVRFKLRLAGRLLLRSPPAFLTWLREILPLFGFDAARRYPPAHVVYLQNRNAVAGWDGTDYLRAIKVPTLVILGQRDTLFSDASYKDVARLVPGAEQVVIPVSAHQVMVERPDAVNRAIDRFLATQFDPLKYAEQRAAQKLLRREARKQLEMERPWLKFYDSRTPYRIKPPTLPLHRLLETTARRFAGTVALEYYGGQLTWSELDRLANRFAHGLISMRVRKGERVMLALPNTPQWVIAYFGILKAGASAVLVDPNLSQANLQERIADTDSVLLIVGARRREEVRELLDVESGTSLRRIVLASHVAYMGLRERVKLFLAQHVGDAGEWEWFGRVPAAGTKDRRLTRFHQVLARGHVLAPDVTSQIEDEAVIVYTFGLRHPALPVALTHRNLASNALQLRHWLPESRPGDERFLAHQPLFSSYGLTGLLHLAVYLGASLVLVPDHGLPALLKAVKRTRPTYFPTTPRVVRQLAHTPGVRRFGLATIRVCAVSGSPLPQEIREEFEKITRGRLLEAFGLAEASPAAIAMPIASRRHSGAVGLPLPDTQVKVLDLDTGLPASPDHPGELWIRGPQVFHGYAGKEGRLESLTEQRLIDGWLATGDVASLDEDGFVTIIDRKDNIVVRSGQRVFPRLIEETLFEHPAVAQAIVKFRPDEEGVPHLIAEVMLHRNMHISLEDLFKYCAKRLHASALPDSIVVLQEDAIAP